MDVCDTASFPLRVKWPVAEKPHDSPTAATAGKISIIETTDRRESASSFRHSFGACRGLHIFFGICSAPFFEEFRNLCRGIGWLTSFRLSDAGVELHLGQTCA
ncbi:hypothetical protein [Bradyrhizobium sp. BWA-3-5]|uniref:hypothetical protein n=1 Tax=Bradyrhizobium sp. BWA-3-5 TaxID=3080013 RepID=UPI00293E13AF|nr:hypothetical protein [Bradyrhizobium sp. BWA-3-5]WOH63825.1 hypothetical protein RX331_24390 [Bradyrhizobium sp. BWA-3-5]